MQSQSISSNTPTVNAPSFSQAETVSPVRDFHQCAAMHAAQLVRCQYTRESKSQFRRECLDHLKASLESEKKASA